MKKQIIFSIIIGLVIFVVGAGLGIFYKDLQIAPQTAKLAQVQAQAYKSAAQLKVLSSAVISSVNAIGTVEKISGRLITLNNSGQRVEIPIQENAKIYRFTTSVSGAKKNPTPVQTNITISDIKVGDYLDVNVKIYPDGQIMGVSIIASAPVAATKK